MVWELKGVPQEVWEDVGMCRMMVCNRSKAAHWHEVAMRVLVSKVREAMEEGMCSHGIGVFCQDSWHTLIKKAAHKDENGGGLHSMNTTRCTPALRLAIPALSINYIVHQSHCSLALKVGIVVRAGTCCQWWSSGSVTGR